jgi:hypothetical protein
LHLFDGPIGFLVVAYCCCLNENFFLASRPLLQVSSSTRLAL